jgi:serine/threonine protein phosphatase 1
VTATIAFIGDVHGVLSPLVEAVDRAQEVADTIVLLGDYVNRGSQSRQVLDFLVEARAALDGRINFLAGHHDLAFLDALDHDRLDFFLRMGGAATLSSYPRYGANGGRLTPHQRVPQSHVDFLRRLEPSFSTETCYAAHDQAGALELTSGRFGVFGHRLLPDGIPLITDDVALIDTGCGTLPDGRLTCFLWPSRRWFQMG